MKGDRRCRHCTTDWNMIRKYQNQKVVGWICQSCWSEFGITISGEIGRKVERGFFEKFLEKFRKYSYDVGGQEE